MASERVVAVDFGLFSPEEVAQLAVVRVSNSNNISGGLPVSNSCCDHRLGTTDRRLRCGTCNRGLSTCSGHYGIIPLAHPVYHCGFLTYVYKLLKLTCYFCSELLLPPSVQEQLLLQSRRDRRKCLSLALAAHRPSATCPACRSQNPAYTKTGTTLRADFSRVAFADAEEAVYCQQRAFTAADARLILQGLRPEHCRALGLDPERVRPELFILTCLLVPPLLIRPCTSVADGSRIRGQDDLTVKLSEIVKVNAATRACLEIESATLLDCGLSTAAVQAVADLAFHVNTFFHNEGRGHQGTSYQRSGLPFKSLTARLRGKEGRIRGTMVGKRVNFSARSVVSPDPCIDADEIGVPFQVARVLTVPEQVTTWNRAVLQRRVRLGANCLGGAASLRKCGGAVLLLAYCDAEQAARELEPGDVVERYLRDGDVVLFNRQPSLHRGSLLGQRVRLMPYRTFRVNLVSSPSTNMDCDGDEMNVHVPQSLEAQAETRLLIYLPYQIVSPQGNKPCMGLVQEGILGLYLLSDPACTLPRGLFLELQAVLRYGSRRLVPPPLGPTVSGALAVELLFEPDLAYSRQHSGAVVRVVHGRLLEGRLDKSVLGTSTNSLVHVLWLHAGPSPCCRFLSDAQRLACAYLQHRSFSVSLSDCLVPPSLLPTFAALVKRAEATVQLLAQHPDLVDSTMQDTERAATRVANGILTDVGKAVHGALDPRRNSLLTTINCGSKGNIINLAQIMGCVGQQVLEGRRIASVGPGGKPVIPLAPETSDLGRHGFVARSYVEGLDEVEFYFHAMAGREGLIDTSVKTAGTGYLQRRLMKALETLRVEADGTVRNSRGHVIQACYGGDGYDACYLQRLAPLPPLSPRSLMTCHDLEAWVHTSDFQVPAEADACRVLSQHAGAARLTVPAPEVPSEYVAPLSLLHARQEAEVAAAVEDTAQEVEDYVTWLEGLLAVLPAHLAPHGQHVLLQLLLRWDLRSGLLTTPNSLPAWLAADGGRRAAFAEALWGQLRRSRAAAGEMVGAVAAQSIGSDATQMTLNVFHHAGVASKDVTLGVPRLKELTDCARKIKTPTMRLPAAAPYQATEAPFTTAPTFYPTLTLESLIETMDVLNEPVFTSEVSPEDAYICAREQTLLLEPEAFEAGASSWVVRFVLKPARLLKRRLTPAIVAQRLRAALPALQILPAEPEMPVWFLRVRALAAGPRRGRAPRAEDDPYATAALCREASLQGLPRVTRTLAERGPLHFWAHDRAGHWPRAAFLLTEGTNLEGVLGHPAFEADMCVSNDVAETLATLGVEAAAAVLFHELQHCLQFDGNYINARHVLLLVDLMTYLGHLLPISRHGLNRLHDNGVLARCSFEETCDQLFDAAAYGERDWLLGVTETVCLGQPSPIGTGAVAALADAPGRTLLQPAPRLPEEPLPESWCAAPDEDEPLLTVLLEPAPVVDSPAACVDLGNVESEPAASSSRPAVSCAVFPRLLGGTSCTGEFAPSTPRCLLSLPPPPWHFQPSSPTSCRRLT